MANLSFGLRSLCVVLFVSASHHGVPLGIEDDGRIFFVPRCRNRSLLGPSNSPMDCVEFPYVAQEMSVFYPDILLRDIPKQ